MKGKKILGVCLIALPFMPAAYYMTKQIGITGAVIVIGLGILGAVFVITGANLLSK